MSETVLLRVPVDMLELAVDARVGNTPTWKTWLCDNYQFELYGKRYWTTIVEQPLQVQDAFT